MRKKLMTDSKICTGCRYCEIVCSLVHDPAGLVNPRRARVVVHHDLFNGVASPVVCKQCTKPLCKEACRFEAMPLDARLGVPTIDVQKCTGCMACLEACPFGAIFYDDDEGVAIMCDLCGGDPQCVKFCRALPHVGFAALAYTTPKEWSQRRVRLAQARE